MPPRATPGLGSPNWRIGDLGASVPELYRYALAGVSGTVTMTFYFVDLKGAQISKLLTLSVPTTGDSFMNLCNTNSLGFSDEAVGVKGQTNGDLFVGLSGNTDGTIGETPTTGYPILAQTTYFTLGRA